jgi:hypothetical protein
LEVENGAKRYTNDNNGHVWYCVLFGDVGTYVVEVIMRYECSYCGSPDVILISGKNYCQVCIANYDAMAFGYLLKDCIPKGEIAPTLLEKFYKWAFDTVKPKLSDIPKLYTRVERGKWLEKTGRFEISQEMYLKKAFMLFLSKRRKEVKRVERPTESRGKEATNRE